MNKCQIISRVGKATGKSKSFFNTLNLSDETIQLIHWSNITKQRLMSNRWKANCWVWFQVLIFLANLTINVYVFDNTE